MKNKYPRLWQGFFAGALMETAGGTLASIIYEVLIFVLGLTGIKFASAFGLEMSKLLITQFCYILLIPVILTLLFKNDFRATLRIDKGLNFAQICLILFMGICAYVPAQFINSIFISITSSFMGEPSDMFGATEPNSLTQLFSGIIFMGLLPGVCEEIMFRGYIMRSLESKGKVFAVLISSVMFSLMHGTFQQMPYAFLLGVLLGTVTMVSDSLCASILLHSFLNTVSVIITYPPAGEIFARYEDLLISLSFKVAPILIAGALLLFIKISKKEETENLRQMESPTEIALSIGLFIFFAVTNIASGVSNWQ